MIICVGGGTYRFEVKLLREKRRETFFPVPHPTAEPRHFSCLIGFIQPVSMKTTAPNKGGIQPFNLEVLNLFNQTQKRLEK
jgi:hypothetical protein